MSDTIFIDGFWVEKSKYGFKVSVCLEDFKEFANKNAKKSESNSKHYINLFINESKDGDKAYASLDTFVPDPNYKKGDSMPETETISEDQSLPF